MTKFANEVRTEMLIAKPMVQEVVQLYFAFLIGTWARVR